ncbi:MAG: polysaccharide deacetylase family protein [Clostridiales bacterium]|nr:polysaccharide deacetylase family protein [Clostridiales bacterium]MBR2820724.1 polysaccharide deacetylase family protein [Clostridiales bacterium]
MKKKKKPLALIVVAALLIGAAGFACYEIFGVKRGWVKTEQGTSYYDKSGHPYTGFIQINDDRRYFDPETKFMATGETVIDGKQYLFDSEGVMLIGFQTVDGVSKYYDPETGAMKTGWFESDTGTCYFDESSGGQVHGWYEINGNKYYFDKINGNMAKGEFDNEDGKYYADPATGIVALGLTVIEGKQYYFDDETGLMRTGWIDVGDGTYFFDETTGAGVDGIVELQDGKYGFIGGQVIKSERAMAGNHLYYFDENGKVVREIDGSKPMVALTYDDGPSMYTDSIIDTFEEYGAKCTFFIVGDRISWNEDVTRREGELGYQQANHTYGHNRLTSLDQSGQTEALKKTDDELIRVTGKPSLYLRPPEGRFDDNLKACCNCPIILWSVDSQDWKSRDKTAVCNKIIGKVQDGDIVLMHDLYQSTADATKEIVPALINSGFQLVTVEEMGLLKTNGAGLENGTVYYSIPNR